MTNIYPQTARDKELFEHAIARNQQIIDHNCAARDAAIKDIETATAFIMQLTRQRNDYLQSLPVNN